MSLKDTRASGILLPVTSLPGPYGIGDLGPAARQFIDQLAAAGQRYWQVLPLGPTGYADSPYLCFSSFAGNPLLISFDALIEAGWLRPAEVADAPPLRRRTVEYGPVIDWHKELLGLAFERFVTQGGENEADFKTFCQQHAAWLEDYALFMALKEANGMRSWVEWPAGKLHLPEAALHTSREHHALRIREERFRQWVFDRQWQALKDYAHARGVQIIGDIPIYVAHDSSDVWTNRGLFELDDTGQPTFVAGVPPDYFSATGQRWGSPLYTWDVHRRTGYQWWVARVLRALDWYDVLRIDHFRAFYDYWRIPAHAPTAVQGTWVDGPRDEFFAVLGAAIQNSLGKALPAVIVAEDLGDKMEAVIAWRKHLGLLGMKILQFAFGAREGESRFLPVAHGRGLTDDCIMYTGTHDNSTVLGWWLYEATPALRDGFRQLAAGWGLKRHYDEEAIHWAMIEIAAQSNSPLCIVPLQDVLGIGRSGRLNTPAVESGNWRWRCLAAELADTAAWERLRQITAAAGRCTP